jgi:S-DNA-T family DNA segregation ATPase FtsK/SpoIIIE
METQLLNFQADRIEMVLAAHKAHARVWGGRLTPRTIQFHLAPAPTTKLGKLEALTEEIALALGAPAARLTRTDGTLSLEVPRRDSRLVTLADLEARLQNDDALRRALACPGTAILGLDSEGVPLLIRLSSPDVAHCLIAGTTGSGKTELARTIIASLMQHQKPRDLQLALFDPKAHGFARFAQLPHLLFPIVQDADAMLVRLRFLAYEMEQRDRDQMTRPRIVVVIDELADVLQTGGSELEHHLTRLVQRGRSAGVSVVACTQKPTASAVGTLIKANFPVRLVGRVASSEDARVAAGIGGTGAEKLVGRGDFLLIAAGEVIRFQAARVAERDVVRESALPMLAQLRRVK